MIRFIIIVVLEDIESPKKLSVFWAQKFRN